MAQIIFSLAELRNRTPFRLGVGPSFQGSLPLPVQKLIISGVTKDSTGVALASCNVSLYRTSDGAFMESVVSDGSGNYSFSTVGLAQNYYVLAYKAGSPDVAGTTSNALVGVAA